MRRASLASALALAVVAAGLPAAAGDLLRELRRIELPGVAGRIDHMALDAGTGRLYVAALGADAVLVVDLERGALLAQLSGLHEPQGVLVLPELARVLVSNGRAAYASVFDTATREARARIPLPEDGDNVRREGSSGRIWIGCGSGSDAALVAVDAASARAVGRIALPGHPESFQLESRGRRIFVNVPAARAVLVLDRQRGEVIARWPLPARRNFPMALDEERGRLLVATRSPPRLLALDTASGRVVAQVATLGDADDVFVDTREHRVYVSGGEGAVEAFALRPGDRYESLERWPTRRGARTSLFLAELGQLLVALPRQGGTPAQILVLGVSGARPGD